MKTTRVLLSGFLMGCVVSCAAGSAEPEESLFGTNVLLGVRYGQSLISPQSAGVRTEPLFGQRRRLTLDLLPTYSLPSSGELPVRSDAGTPRERPNGVEWAERVNVEAMDRYREGWEKLLSAPRSQAVPVLYPPNVQETSPK